ncbi:hypothetical protein DPX16_8658 [Anabarilius grahami]|uniref:Uncharacterized protein n=1 Tax=Anabarilius grahami TaxID=495550 RepID=A0A3N0Y9Y2_ANAGA|nr:hypothetical protein DPX16_8658 [Anabarilius grahami]
MTEDKGFVTEHKGKYDPLKPRTGYSLGVLLFVSLRVTGETANQLCAKRDFDITCAGRYDSSIWEGRGAQNRGPERHKRQIMRHRGLVHSWFLDSLRVTNPLQLCVSEQHSPVE